MLSFIWKLTTGIKGKNWREVLYEDNKTDFSHRIVRESIFL